MIYDGASLFWRSMVKVLPLITWHLIWEVGIGNQVQITGDPWIGSDADYIISEDLKAHLIACNLIYLSTLASENLLVYGHTIWKQAQNVEIPRNILPDWIKLHNKLIKS
jgi:hypothetical protein